MTNMETTSDKRPSEPKPASEPVAENTSKPAKVRRCAKGDKGLVHDKQREAFRFEM